MITEYTRFLSTIPFWQSNYSCSTNYDPRKLSLPPPPQHDQQIVRTPNFLSRFPELPTELQLKILRLAIRNAVRDKFHKYSHYYAVRTWDEFRAGKRNLEGGKWWDHVGRERRERRREILLRRIVMRRYDLVASDCLRGLLGATRLIREETINYVEQRLKRGISWRSAVRSGAGQEGRESNRRDVRRWRAAGYYFDRDDI